MTGRTGIGGEVRLVGLARDYGDVQAVRATDLTVRPGEFLTFLGASGSGKTTTLMMIAGFVTPSAGDILIDGASIAGLPPDKRNLGVVFQNYALFPHMTVAQNVGFPLRMRHMPKAEARAAVAEALAIVKLEAFGGRRIAELSGGQQQRVALARALVFRPPVLLMDEPLGALDRRLRDHMQSEIKRIQKSLGLTVIYVTHDQEEAMAMSDRIAVMDHGVIHQVGSPSEIYEIPATEYVARFIGESNLLDGTVVSVAGDVATVAMALGGHAVGAARGLPPGKAVRLLLRPEAFASLEGGAPLGANRLAGVVETAEYLGQSIRYLVRVDETEILLRETRREGIRRHAPGDRIVLEWSPDSALLLPAEGTTP